MDVQLSQPVSSAQQLCTWLQSAMPQYQFKVVGSNVVLVKSSWVGLAIAPKGNTVHLSGDMPPSAGNRVVLNMLFPLGILPGILAYLIFWLSVRGTWIALEKRVAATLRGEQLPPEPVGADGKPLANGPDLMKRLAPAWMLGVSLAAIVPAGCASCVVYDTIGDRYLDQRWELEHRETRLEISQANLERAKKKLPIPAGCPEEKLQGWDPDLRDVCHGCAAHDYYGNPGVEKITRNQETLYCPTVAQLQDTVKQNEERYDELHGTAIGTLVKGVLWLMMAGVLWFGSAAGAVVWRVKNKKAKTALKEQPAQPPPAPQPVQVHGQAAPQRPWVAPPVQGSPGHPAVYPQQASPGYSQPGDPRYSQHQPPPHQPGAVGQHSQQYPHRS